MTLSRGGVHAASPEHRRRRRSPILPMLLAFVVLLALPASARARSFDDVPAAHPYRLQVEVMAQLGVVTGYPGDDYRPDRPVTRAQFAKMVLRALRVPVTEQDVCTFADVPASGPDGLFPDNYVAAAARRGLVEGASGATSTRGPLFAPYRNVTLAQMVTIATRATGRPLADPPRNYRSAWGAFSPTHGPVARVAQYNGLLREFPLQSMDPWRSATRAEAAALLFNLMGSDPAGVNGRFLGTSADLVRYFRDHGQTGELFSVDLDTLARFYVQYGRRFGIRADVAWAQMIHETGYGHYGGDVAPEQNNMAGIGATGGGVPGNSFASAELGVIAQFAHLAWYVYPEHLDDPYCVRSTDPSVPGDPRHFETEAGPHRGNVHTIADLGGKWAVSDGYGPRLQQIVAGIKLTTGW